MLCRDDVGRQKYIEFSYLGMNEKLVVQSAVASCLTKPIEFEKNTLVRMEDVSADKERVLQSSVLGPLLRSLMWNGILAPPLSRKADLVVVAVVEQDVEVSTNEAISVIKTSLKIIGFVGTSSYQSGLSNT